LIQPEQRLDARVPPGGSSAHVAPRDERVVKRMRPLLPVTMVVPGCAVAAAAELVAALLPAAAGLLAATATAAAATATAGLSGCNEGCSEGRSEGCSEGRDIDSLGEGTVAAGEVGTGATEAELLELAAAAAAAAPGAVAAAGGGVEI